MDDEHKLKLRRALVWHSTLGTKPTSIGLGKKMGKSASAYNAPAKPGTKMCKTFNAIRCFKGHEHPEWQHVSFFCPTATNRAFPDSENLCIHKTAQAQTKNG